MSRANRASHRGLLLAAAFAGAFLALLFTSRATQAAGLRGSIAVSSAGGVARLPIGEVSQVAANALSSVRNAASPGGMPPIANQGGGANTAAANRASAIASKMANNVSGGHAATSRERSVAAFPASAKQAAVKQPRTVAPTRQASSLGAQIAPKASGASAPKVNGAGAAPGRQQAMAAQADVAKLAGQVSGQSLSAPVGQSAAKGAASPGAVGAPLGGLGGTNAPPSGGGHGQRDTHGTHAHSPQGTGATAIVPSATTATAAPPLGTVAGGGPQGALSSPGAAPGAPTAPASAPAGETSAPGAVGTTPTGVLATTIGAFTPPLSTGALAGASSQPGAIIPAAGDPLLSDSSTAHKRADSAAARHPRATMSAAGKRVHFVNASRLASPAPASAPANEAPPIPPTDRLPVPEPLSPPTSPAPPPDTVQSGGSSAWGTHGEAILPTLAYSLVAWRAPSLLALAIPSGISLPSTSPSG